MNEYKRYDRYKFSGIEWIGEIPEHWNVTNLGYKSRMIVPMRDKPTEFNGEIPWIRIEDVEGKYIEDSRSEQRVSQDLIDSMNLKVFPVGTVLCTCSCSMGTTTIVRRPLVSNQTFIGIVPKKNLSTDFLYYTINANSERLQYLGEGAIQQYLSRHDFEHLGIAFPPLGEQVDIANFLDEKISELDSLIYNKENLIALLKEKRQAIINEAVTKGLNPGVKMKDSGIEWIGEIPEHWEMKKLKYLGKAIIGLTYSPEETSDDGMLVLRSSNIKNNRIVLEDNVYVNKEIPSKLITQYGDILICSRNGSRALIGKNAYIDKENEGLTFGAFMTIFRSRYWRYVYFVLNSTLFKFQSASFLTSTINQLTINNLNSFVVPLPPETEQYHICNILAVQTVSIDTLIMDIEMQIEKLKEYRQSLISEAVTGKIDVRDYVTV